MSHVDAVRAEHHAPAVEHTVVVLGLEVLDVQRPRAVGGHAVESR